MLHLIYCSIRYCFMYIIKSVHNITMMTPDVFLLNINCTYYAVCYETLKSLIPSGSSGTTGHSSSLSACQPNPRHEIRYNKKFWFGPVLSSLNHGYIKLQRMSHERISYKKFVWYFLKKIGVAIPFDFFCFFSSYFHCFKKMFAHKNRNMLGMHIMRI